MRTAVVFATLAILASSASADMLRGRGSFGQSQERSLLQTYDRELSGEGVDAFNGAKVKDTPVTRVVNLLKEMSATLSKEMEEDESLYHTLACWCNNGEYEKSEFIEATEAKISELQSTIESLTAKSAELATQIKELETEVAADKAALAEATELREKQQQEFHGSELDSIQAIENTKAALEVLAKHHGANAATPWGQSPAGSLLEVDTYSKNKNDGPWADAHEDRYMSHALDDFMRHTGFTDTEADEASALPAAASSGSPSKPQEQFLQSRGASKDAASASATAGSWSAEDSAVVRNALRSVSKFSRAKHGEAYYPSYHATSGEIVGVLKELKEEMESDLSEAQKTEMDRAATFASLRAAKTQEIESGEAMAEKKEDEKATTDNALAEAKEDLGQEGEALAEAQEFLKNLKVTCAEADKNFEARKAARLLEIKAVTETITILTKDEARDAMSGTYSFLQASRGSSVSQSQRDSKQRKQAAAATLRKAAIKTGNPDLSVLATSVELDAFTKVKKAIDDMIAMLKTQQEDEVKFTDWCKAEIQANEMTTAKTEDHKADLEAAIAELAETIKSLAKGIVDAQAQIAELQTELQRATEDRIKENLDYQKTVADQTVTI
jgi:septal ring factor EnvC (AmiA/AmiB activator)